MKIQTEFNVGDEVWDTLTEKKVKIIGLSFATGKQGINSKVKLLDVVDYWVDDKYLEGGRHLWEIEIFKFYSTRLDAEKYRKKGQRVCREAAKGYYLYTPKKSDSVRILFGD